MPMMNAATSPAEAAAVMCVGQKEKKWEHVKSNVRDVLPQWLSAGEPWLLHS